MSSATDTLGATGEAGASGSPVPVATGIPSTLRRPGAYRGVLHETRDQAAALTPPPSTSPRWYREQDVGG